MFVATRDDDVPRVATRAARTCCVFLPFDSTFSDYLFNSSQHFRQNIIFKTILLAKNALVIKEGIVPP